MFSHRQMHRKDQKLLAVCDEDLLGEVLSGEERNFEVKEEFYGGEIIDENELVGKASESTIINAVGNKVVSLLSDQDFFDEDKVLEIDGVSHAQMARI